MDISKLTSKGEDCASSYASRIERDSNAVVMMWKLGNWADDSKHGSCSWCCINCRCLDRKPMVENVEVMCACAAWLSIEIVRKG